MLLDLITIEHAEDPTILTQPAQQVAFPLSPKIKTLIKDMEETLYHVEGVGLAAPQVRQPVKIILVHISEKAKKIREDADQTIPMTVFINPSYEPLNSEFMRQDWEGCFSVEGTVGKVPRYLSIKFRAQDKYY